MSTLYQLYAGQVQELQETVNNDEAQYRVSSCPVQAVASQPHAASVRSLKAPHSFGTSDTVGPPQERPPWQRAGHARRGLSG